MAIEGQFETLVDTCLAAYEVIKDSGSPEVQAMMRLVLFQIGLEIADRQAKNGTALNDN